MKNWTHRAKATKILLTIFAPFDPDTKTTLVADLEAGNKILQTLPKWLQPAIPGITFPFISAHPDVKNSDIMMFAGVRDEFRRKAKKLGAYLPETDFNVSLHHDMNGVEYSVWTKEV